VLFKDERASLLHAATANWPIGGGAGRRGPEDRDFVFLSSRGHLHWDHRSPWKRSVRRAGVDGRKGLSLYSLRHSKATHFLEHGSPSDLQAILGHSSYATTSRYTRALGARTRRGIEALDFVQIAELGDEAS